MATELIEASVPKEDIVLAVHEIEVNLEYELASM